MGPDVFLHLEEFISRRRKEAEDRAKNRVSGLRRVTMAANAEGSIENVRPSGVSDVLLTDVAEKVCSRSHI